MALIRHELSGCGHRTTRDVIQHLLVEIEWEVGAEALKSLLPLHDYAIRALVTFLHSRNVPAQAIWDNIIDWSGWPISGGASRVREKQDILERMTRFLNHTPDKAVKPGFEVTYIDNAYDLGFSAAQIIHYLTRTFPKASTWLT